MEPATAAEKGTQQSLVHGNEEQQESGHVFRVWLSYAVGCPRGLSKL